MRTWPVGAYIKHVTGKVDDLGKDEFTTFSSRCRQCRGYYFFFPEENDIRVFAAVYVVKNAV